MTIDAPSQWHPDWRVSPGEVLAELLEERAMSQSELARRMGRPVKTINEIVNGKAALTPETAVQLELTLGTSSRVWTNLEADYRESLAREGARSSLAAEADWLANFPIPALVRLGVIPKTSDTAARVAHVLAFFGVASRIAWEKQWSGRLGARRDSPAYPSERYPLATWLRIGELRAQAVTDVPAFDEAVFLSAVDRARALTNTVPPSAAVARLQALFRQAGVVIVLVPELRGIHVSGATQWIGKARPVIQLSLRHRADDQFWFTVFHECGHVVRGGHKEYVDVPASANGHDEELADAFARDALIPRDALDSFRAEGRFDAGTVQAFAEAIGVAPGIVVGRLQRDGTIQPGRLNFLKRRYDWHD